MLAIDVEYLAGVSYAATSGDKGTAEWPPQPDRLFSAFVDSWASGGQDGAERQALEWLERLPPPLVVASAAEPRDVVTAYVPPNDGQVTGLLGDKVTEKALSNQRSVMPYRPRRERQFPAAIPEQSTVVFTWPGAAEPGRVLPALNRLAARTACLGHSAALVRVYARSDGIPPMDAAFRPDERGTLLLRWVYPGRLAELETGYEGARRAGTAWRPRPGVAVAYAGPDKSVDDDPHHSVFSRVWHVLADAGGTAPALTAFPIVAKTLHRALVDVCSAQGGPVPELLTGTREDGSPSQTPHLAMVPLADIGWKYSSGRLLGLALVLPRSVERQFVDPAVQAVVRAVRRFLGDHDGQTGGALQLGRLGVWKLAPAIGDPKASLRPARYLGRSRVWASVTPIVLDRFPKDRPGETAQDLVGHACEHVGLPRPMAVDLYKYSAFSGAPPSAPPGGSPSWIGWTFPSGSSLSSRPRRHVALQFAQEVEGPVLLGAGRYQGLGLCLPLDDVNVDA